VQLLLLKQLLEGLNTYCKQWLIRGSSEFLKEFEALLLLVNLVLRNLYLMQYSATFQRYFDLSLLVQLV
jgi:hypothetical protein